MEEERGRLDPHGVSSCDESRCGRPAVERVRGVSPRERPSKLQGGTRFEGVEDDVEERSFEAAERFVSALAFAAFALGIVACWRVVAGLRVRDSVAGGVELAVAAAVEPVALCAAWARLQRRDAATPGGLRVASEAIDR